MPHPAAEKSFEQGVVALSDEQPLVALDRFLEAMRIEQRHGQNEPDMRYLSYYGLSLARAGQAPQTALEAAQLAVRHEPTHAVLWLNLGRVHAEVGRRVRALGCFERGLRLAPDHPTLAAARAEVDRRRPTFFRFLRRTSFLNRWAGRWCRTV